MDWQLDAMRYITQHMSIICEISGGEEKLFLGVKSVGEQNK